MKTVVALLVFVATATGMRQWIGLPDTDIRELDQQWLQDQALNPDVAADPSRPEVMARLADLLSNTNLVDSVDVEENDHGKPDGEKPIDGENSTEGGKAELKKLHEALGSLVESLRDTIIPVMTKLKEKRDEETESNAQEFFEALKRGVSDEELTRTLGRHVRLMSQRCHIIQVSFLYAAKHLGLFEALNNATEGDEFDTEDIMMEVVEAAEQNDFEMFDRIEEMIRYVGLQKNSALRAFGMMSKLLTHAACGQHKNFDGLIYRIGELVHSEEPEVEVDLKKYVLPYLYQAKACKGKQGKLLQAVKGPKEGSLKHRLLQMVFEPCEEVKIVRFGVDTAMQAIAFFSRLRYISEETRKASMELAGDVKWLLEHGQEDAADSLVGDTVLTAMRRGMLVGLAVHEKLNPGKPDKPGPSFDESELLTDEKDSNMKQKESSLPFRKLSSGQRN